MANDFVLLDTNIVSYGFKRDSRRLLYFPHLENKTAAIAAQTLAELELMPLLNNWSAHRHSSLRLAISNYLLLDTDENICRIWALIQADARKTGRNVAVADAWIAATALAYDVSLVTHNPKDFQYVKGLSIISEI